MSAEEIKKDGGDISKDTTGRFCGPFSKQEDNSGFFNQTYKTIYTPINNPPQCPNGMVQDGDVKLTEYCSKKDVDETSYFFGPTVEGPLDNKVIKGYERRCKYAAPPGFEKPMVNNISKIKPLPSQDELLEMLTNL